jgi:5-methylcytosine-specific restriction protein A
VPIREHLQAILDDLAEARTEPLKGHALAYRIAHSWREAVEEVVADKSYLVTGSPGKGQWAHTVWLAVFDRMVTETAQQGYYLVYLIPSDGARAFLSLNQGTEEIYSQVGGRHYRQVLEDTAARDRDLLEGEEIYELLEGPLDLGATSRLTRGYESGNIFAVEYGSILPPEPELEADLTRLLLLYASLVEARDQVQEEADDSPGFSVKSKTEAAKYRWHKRAERSRSLAAAAKKFHGTRCQVEACGKELSEIYGEVAGGYIEAHHLTPFASLEGRPTDLDPKTDFAVVCPDCHRMLHRKPDPYSLKELSARMLT